MASRRFCLGGFADRTERHGICMKIKRVMVAAPKSGSGKTTVVCALLQMLKKEGLQVVSCKCGPDYIDPMFHEKAIQVPSKNLDTFFTGEEGTRELFSSHVEHKDAAVLEGVMGLYDGLGGIREEQVDIIFMDPPYDCGHEQAVLALLGEKSYVTQDTLIVVESSLKTDFSWLEETGFRILEKKGKPVEKHYRTNKHVFIKRTPL